MRRLYALLPLLISLIVAGVVLGQGTGNDESFAVAYQIGQPRPQGIRYDPNYDRMVMVDSRGRLLLAAATDQSVQHVLYESGTYNSYRFSHDGRWLALAIDRRVELWDTRSGMIAATLEPDGARSVTGPLMFADDDQLLLLTAIVPAPPETRRSENDTSNIFWLWDIPAALETAPSSLPNRVLAFPFFDYRHQFVLGPNDKAIAALPGLLNVLDLNDPDLAIINTIETQRFEQDPITVWFSLRDDMMYVRPINQNNLIQIDSETGDLFDIRPGSSYALNTVDRLDNLDFWDHARIIGEPNSHSENTLLRLLLGGDYRARYNYHPLTVYLLDILEPVTMGQEEMGFLIYIYDDETASGTIDFRRPGDVQQMVLHPENDQLLVRRASGDQPLEVYDLNSGGLVTRYFPTYRDPNAAHILAYDNSGEIITSNFERFATDTGELLYQDLNINPGFQQYFFTQDSDSLVTLNDEDWWQWDIDTGEVIRREKLRLRGNLAQTSPDAHRFLTYSEAPGGTLVEIVELGIEERRTLLIETIPGRGAPVSINPSPTWTNFLVVYASTPTSPGEAVALYNMEDGLRWFLADADLPFRDGRVYGWADDTTAYVYSEDLGSSRSPERIYGLAYHASGVPQCLVDEFPDEWTRWRNLWERLNENVSPGSLGRLTQRLCDALPTDIEGVEAVFNPTATPTLPPITATPVGIVGVPRCLTSRFPDEGLAYAEEWRKITEGLSETEIDELEVLLCEGLGSAGVVGTEHDVTQSNIEVEVMLINADTGLRSTSPVIPRSREQRPSMQLVLEEFERTRGVVPTDPLLSPNRELLAARTSSNHIVIYRLLKSYDQLVAEAEDRELARVSNTAATPNRVSVRPTATRAGDVLGQPRPTITPTITPTAPPPPTQIVEQSNYKQVEEICPSETLLTLSDAPSNFTPTGSLFTRNAERDVIWVLNPATGRLYPDENLPRCGIGINCDYSPDQQHIITSADDLAVSRVDGSAEQVLYEAFEQSAWPQNIYWLNSETIEYVYAGYLPDERRDSVQLHQRYDITSGEFSEPFIPDFNVSINRLNTEVVSRQPDAGSQAVVRTSFRVVNGNGFKYYIYDYETEEAEYFARIPNSSQGDMSFTWHPRGRELYYRYPTDPDWYSYDPASREHRLLGDLPDGKWSHEGRYRVAWFALSEQETNERIAEAQAQITPTPGATPVPVTVDDLLLPNIRIWDSETGLTRHYCIPVDGALTGSELYWSPDSRYLAFRVGPFTAEEAITSDFQIVVLDTETGVPVEVAADPEAILLWTNHTPEDAR